MRKEDLIALIEKGNDLTPEFVEFTNQIRKQNPELLEEVALEMQKHSVREKAVVYTSGGSSVSGK